MFQFKGGVRDGAVVPPTPKHKVVLETSCILVPPIPKHKAMLESGLY